MAHLIYLRDENKPGGEDLWVNVDAIDWLQSQQDKTRIGLRDGRVLVVPETLSVVGPKVTSDKPDWQ